MVILGARATMQFVDGSRSLPVFTWFEKYKGRIAITAPALAYVADVTRAQSESDRPVLENSLRDILEKSRRREELGLSAPPPAYKFLPFGYAEIELFPRVIAALQPMGSNLPETLHLQVLAIACATDLPLALMRNNQTEETMRLMQAAGLHTRPEWME